MSGTIGWATNGLKVGDKITFGCYPGRLFWMAPGRAIVPYPTPKVKETA